MGSKNSKQPRNDSASQDDCEFSNQAQNDIVNQSVNCAFDAVKNGDLSGLISEIRNIDINGKDEKRKTLAHHAAEGGFAELIKVLADHGADFKLRDESGVSPIRIATDKGQVIDATKEEYATRFKDSALSNTIQLSKFWIP